MSFSKAAALSVGLARFAGLLLALTPEIYAESLMALGRMHVSLIPLLPQPFRGSPVRPLGSIVGG